MAPKKKRLSMRIKTNPIIHFHVPHFLPRFDQAAAGPLLMLAAALVYTLLNLLIKLLGPHFGVWQIGFYRFLGGVIVLVVVFGRHRNPYRGHNMRLLILRGCVGAGAFLSLVTAVRLLPISTALVIFYCFPAFSALFAFLIYGERITFAQICCILLVMIGIAVLFDFKLVGNLLGQTMAVVAGVFAGLTVTLIRSLREKNGPVIIYLYFCTMGALVTTPIFIHHPVFPATPAEVAMVAGIILTSVVGQLLMNQGFFYCRGWEGGVFMSSEVIFTAFVGIAFMHDPITLRFWIGAITIMGSVLALNRMNAKLKKTN